MGAPEGSAPLSVAGRTVGISERVYADGNVDRPVESAKVDIPARHLRGANVYPMPRSTGEKRYCVPRDIDLRSTSVAQAG